VSSPRSSFGERFLVSIYKIDHPCGMKKDQVDDNSNAADHNSIPNNANNGRFNLLPHDLLQSHQP
jgi:hypothetical protein